jgi:hypothetical protein
VRELICVAQFSLAATVHQQQASRTSADFTPICAPLKEQQNGEALNCAREQGRCQLLFRDLPAFMLKSVW